MNGFGGGFLIGQGGSGGGGGGGNRYGNNSGPNSATKSNATPTKVDTKKKGSITPLTIKALLEASNRTDDTVEVDGVPVDQAVVVGRVYRLEEQSTRIILHMDDTTGRIQIAYYKKTDSQANGGIDKFYYEENMYVKAVVVVRPFKAQKLYVSNMLQPVTDYNQIAYHYLSTFLASAYRTKGPLPKEDPNASAQKQAGNATQMQFNPSQDFQAGYQPMSTRDQGHKDPLTLVKETINHIQYNTDNGICKQSQLINTLKNKLDTYTITDCLMKLESKGEICREDSGNRNDPGFVLLGNEDNY